MTSSESRAAMWVAALFAVVFSSNGVAPLYASPPARAGSLHGVVLDAATRAPVSGATVRIRGLGRTERSHADGEFHFDGLAPGTYTLSAERIGYAPAEQRVRVVDEETARATLVLTPSALELSGIVVTGVGSERAAEEAYRPTTVLSDAELRRKLSTTVAATLAGEPGISQRYNGPAAAQPVVRGLSGDRVLVLEDGQRSGDVASTSADHAVTIEPLTAERIEVVRGPAALLYGSNALGGVINVIREEVPRTRPERISGTLSSQLESVNQGITAGASLLAPLGPLSVRGELSGRTAGETRTPEGRLPTSQLEGYNAGVGASWVGERGFVGGAVRDYRSEYGIPGTFNGVTIPGGHEGGVEIQLHRSAARVEGALVSGLGPLESVEADASYIRYDQDEVELGGRSGPVVGTRFRQFTRTANLIARHRHQDGSLRLRGAVGLWALDKNFSAAGSRTGSRPADQLSVAGFAFEELGWDPIRVEVGARYDWSRVAPLSAEESDIGEIRAREFGALSGSLSALYQLRSGINAGIAVSRAFRTPSIEELYSAGPHLANYSFDIGNPDLEEEFGLGTDLFLRAALPRFSGEVSFFRNRIDNYIYYRPTGELARARYPVYQAEQSDATLVGGEGRAQWEFLPGWVVDGTGSYVRGTRHAAAGSEPLPSIPPLHGRLGARHDATRWFGGVSLEGAAAQDRVPMVPLAAPECVAEAGCVPPGEFQSTDGYMLLNAIGGLRWTAWGRLHTLTLQASNLLDATWRDHLSRIKSVAPQPGRNLQLLYRIDL